MSNKPSSKIIKRSGVILAVIGFLHLAVTLYCTVNGIFYPLAFSFVGIITGGILLGDNLRAATLVRWLAAFSLGALIVVTLAVPFVLPLDLVVTYVRLQPADALPTMVGTAMMLGVLLWLCCELGKQPIESALRAARMKPYDIGIAAVLGTLLAAAPATFFGLALNGKSANRIESLAQQKLTAGYQYQVTSISISKSNRGTAVKGTITAWSESEIKQIPIDWDSSQGLGN